MSQDTAELRSIASRLVAKGKGLLASDESIGTIGKRLARAGLANTEVFASGRWQSLCSSKLFEMQKSLL